MKSRLNWRRIWKDFDEWISEQEDKIKPCGECGRRSFDEVEWPEQQKAIERIVEFAMRTNR